jgi:hypothetical protein
MLNSLINKDSLVRSEIINVVLKTNSRILSEREDFITRNLIKIKDLDVFISGVILLNKNNYFGNYSLDYNREISISVTENNDNKFLKKFEDYAGSQIFKNHLIDNYILEEIKEYYNLEKIVYFYLYHKKYYNCFYEINLDKIQGLKEEIYKIKNKDTKIKYFSNKNTISIKKGKEIETANIIEVIFKIFEDIKINYKLDSFIKSNYRTEYLFIKGYIEKFSLSGGVK